MMEKITEKEILTPETLKSYVYRGFLIFIEFFISLFFSSIYIFLYASFVFGLIKWVSVLLKVIFNINNFWVIYGVPFIFLVLFHVVAFVIILKDVLTDE